MTLQRFSLVSFPVDDVPAAIDFYRRALGWEPSQLVEDQMAFYQFNGFVFALGSRAGWEAEGLGIDAPAYAVAAINFATAAQVDAAVEAWVAAGGAVQKMPHDTYWGGYSGYMRDASGNLLEFAVNSEWDITEDGRIVMPPA